MSASEPQNFGTTELRNFGISVLKYSSTQVLNLGRYESENKKD